MRSLKSSMLAKSLPRNQGYPPMSCDLWPLLYFLRPRPSDTYSKLAMTAFQTLGRTQSVPRAINSLRLGRPVSPSNYLLMPQRSPFFHSAATLQRRSICPERISEWSGLSIFLVPPVFGGDPGPVVSSSSPLEISSLRSPSLKRESPLSGR